MQSGRKRKKGGALTFLMWTLFALSAIYVFTLRPEDRSSRPTEFTYSQFKHQIAAGKVKSVVTHQGSMVLEGKLKGLQNERFTVVLPVFNSEALIAELEKAGVSISAKEAPKPNRWFSMFLAVFPIFFLVLIIILIARQFRQMQGGGGGPNSATAFGKSKAKVGDVPKTRFSDVAGANEAKTELQEIIEFLSNPGKFTRLGGKLPKGALLIGPPGTGKTLLARAVAGEAGRPFFSMSGSDFVEMFVGVGASRVRDLFDKAKANAPCIIFIDEIDAVGRHRGSGLGGGHDEREQTLNALLVEMDGFDENTGVIMIAATNRPDVLDPALLRPGRFDRHIVVDGPDVKGREEILRVHTHGKPLEADVNLKMIAKGTPGMVGADLANLANEAALLAARRGKEKICMQDFEDAKDKIMLGDERKSLVLSEDEKRLTAYHEAGHAVVSLKTPGADPIHKVTITPRGRAMGLMLALPEKDRYGYTKEWLIGKLAIAFGGRAAEELIFGTDKITTGASSDIEQATAIARKMITQWGMGEKIGLVAIAQHDQEIFLGRDISRRADISEATARQVDTEIKRLVDTAYEKAKAILNANTALLERIARALLERETLSGEEVAALVTA